MGFFTSPTSYRLASGNEGSLAVASRSFTDMALGAFQSRAISTMNDHSTHPSMGHLILLVFEAVMEVVCVSLPGYIVARNGMFDADKQKFVANLNVALFTPCLIFTKLASQLNADKLLDLAVIPVIFGVQTLVSFLVSVGVSRAFGLKKRPTNFVTAMGVFGNSNSLPISLVISLSQTLKGLHWDKVPGDNDDEVAARGILYLMVFQQLGQLLRWSWGYHVLLAPPQKFDNQEPTAVQDERYRDVPTEQLIPGLDGEGEEEDEDESRALESGTATSNASFESGARTPVGEALYVPSDNDEGQGKPGSSSDFLSIPANGHYVPGDRFNGNMTSFPTMRPLTQREEHNIPNGMKGWIPLAKLHTKRGVAAVSQKTKNICEKAFHGLPISLQEALASFYRVLRNFFMGMWEFMNPPLWAMLIAVFVASIPPLQRLFFEEGSFIANSVTRAVGQSGGVAIPLILVVLGANLARNTIPKDALIEDIEENKIGKKLLVAALISRMLLPTLIMAPLLALMAKYVPVSIVDDPIFVIVCFLLTGAPSALQLAQICQINGVYEGVMSKLLFQSYVIWILPSTLFLVMCALEVVEWAKDY